MYLYILQGTKTNKYYIGITRDLENRLNEHNTNRNHYTGRQHEIWIRVYSKFYDSDSAARVEEIRLKKAKNRKYIEWYIANAGA